MKRLLTLLLISGLFLSTTAYGQSKFKVSLGGEYLIAVGGTAETVGSAYGGSVQGEYLVLPKLSVTASAGYLSLSASKLFKEIYEPWYQTPLKNSIFYPVKAGAKYVIVRNFYAAGEVGASITQSEGSSTSFAYAGGLGYHFAISPKSSIDLSARYETWALSVNSTSTFVGFRAAYSFGF